MTDNQRNAFGFIGKSVLWDEILKAIQESQETLWMHAVSATPKGDDRAHSCGQADGANMIYSMLIALRQEAKRLNGLTEEEDMA
jgi:hypothetical protein